MTMSYVREEYLQEEFNYNRLYGLFFRLSALKFWKEYNW